MIKREEIESETPSGLIEIMRGKQVVHDLVPHVSRHLSGCNGVRFQGYLPEQDVTYFTQKGIFHGMKFVDQETVNQFEAGLRLAGYEVYDKTTNVLGTNIHLSRYIDEPNAIQAALVLKGAHGFHELYDWNLPLSTNPLLDVAPVDSLKDISSTEIKRAKAHASWLIEPDRDVFTLNQHFSERDTPLVAVHATDYFPKNGKIYFGGPSNEIAGRRTIHFGLNGIATASFIGTSEEWKNKKYYVIAPLADLIEHNKPFGGLSADFFFPGPVQLPDTTQVFTSQEAAQEYVEKIGALRELGKRGWNLTDHGEELVLSQSLGLWQGLHSDHHFSDYERCRANGKSHNEALKHAIEYCLTIYPDEPQEPRFELQDNAFLREKVKAFIPGRSSKEQARVAKVKDFALLGYTFV